MQRDLAQMLHIERATLSGVVATLVRKGLVDQVPDSADQRQRILRITAAGRTLWDALPDPIAVIEAVSLDGINDTDLETAIRVLRTATERVTNHLADTETA
jgi:DNA-binding MarR family transcriptional regulator